MTTTTAAEAAAAATTKLTVVEGVAAVVRRDARRATREPSGSTLFSGVLSESWSVWSESNSRLSSCEHHADTLDITAVYKCIASAKHDK